MIRLFIGLDFPQNARDRLALLCSGLQGARWTPPENLHLTLRFIGEIDEPEAEILHSELGRVSAPGFTLTLSGLDIFASGKKPRSLWTGALADPALTLLQGRVESACGRAGLAGDPRKFKPHVTLARLKDTPQAKLASYLAERGLFRLGPIAIKDFVLFESKLSSQGSSYTALARYPLAPIT
jgi:2'-5' RNA ligase